MTFVVLGAFLAVLTPVQVSAQNCEEGFVAGLDRSCVRQVMAYLKDSIANTEIQQLTAQNGWAVATRQQVTTAWEKGVLDQFAFLRIDTGDYCVPIQKDVNSFKRGPNCGDNRGNQGFLYVLAPRQVATQVKIGVIDIQEVLTGSALGRKVMTDLEAFGQEQQTRLEAKRSEIDVLRNRVTDGQLTLAKDQLAKMQAELDTKTGEFKRLSEDAQRAFNQRQGQLLQDIEKQIMPIINQVGAEGGYTAIFRKFDSGLVYADKAIDITRQVIARLDAGPTGK